MGGARFTAACYAIQVWVVGTSLIYSLPFYDPAYGSPPDNPSGVISLSKMMR